MKSESALVGEVTRRLRDAAYPLVQSEVSLDGASRLSVDVLAWAADDNGELLPRLAVEVKRLQRPEIALPLLAQSRATLGTVEHLIVSEQGWFAASPDFRTVEAVEGPTANESGGGELRSVALVKILLRERIWKEANFARGQVGRVGSVFDEAVSVENDPTAIKTASGETIAVEPNTLWQARRAAWNDLSERDQVVGMSSSPPVVANAIATLVGDRLGGTVLDPYCGSGSFLWAIAERAVGEGRSIDAIGRDVNPGILRTASLIAETAPINVSFEAADSFSEPLPEANVIVATLPFGLRLPEPYELENGTTTRNGDVAAVDRCLRALKPSGRAVFQLAPGITFQTQAAGFRSHLANNYRVAALIGCPSGAAYGTRIKTVLMVVDRAPAGQTFVAQLADDWEAQLASEGPTMSAALAHIDAEVGSEL